MTKWQVRIKEVEQELHWTLLDDDYTLAEECAQYVVELQEARNAALRELMEEERSVQGAID